ncbi:M15 family metallopeptidase [Amycolatopsis japonica]
MTAPAELTAPPTGDGNNTKGDLVLPELASAYLDRGNRRPGMITAGDPTVAAFAAIGWTWGGSWTTPTDRMHFSSTGR